MVVDIGVLDIAGNLDELIGSKGEEERGYRCKRGNNVVVAVG